jgi:hypothetical protein
MLKARDILGAAREVLEVAGNEWLRDQRRTAQKSAAEAAAQESSSVRKAKLRKLMKSAEQIHEIDAQIELLLTLPARESETAEPLIRNLRQVRDKLAKDKAKAVWRDNSV